MAVFNKKSLPVILELVDFEKRRRVIISGYESCQIKCIHNFHKIKKKRKF